MYMADKTGLPSDQDMIADCRAARHTYLCGQCRVLTYSTIVRQVDEIIDTCAPADSRIGKVTAVDCAIRTDFDIVFDNDRSEARDSDEFAVLHGVAESLASDDRAGLDYDTVADSTTTADNRPRIETALLTDFDIVLNDATRSEHRVRTYATALSNHGPRANPGIRAERCFRMHVRRWMQRFFEERLPVLEQLRDPGVP